MKFMADKPDNYYDLAIVDPPYGIGHTNNKGQNNLAKTNPDKMMWNKKIPSIEYFNELFRVSKNQIIWGINYFFKYSFIGSGRIIWDKKTTGDFSDCEIAFCSLHRIVKKFEFLWNGMIQQYNKNREKRIHPTQKPIQLYKWLLKNYAKPNDKILDTHGGSMSIAIACHDMNFDLDICELDLDYFESAKKRYDLYVCKGELFWNQKKE